MGHVHQTFFLGQQRESEASDQFLCYHLLVWIAAHVVTDIHDSGATLDLILLSRLEGLRDLHDYRQLEQHLALLLGELGEHRFQLVPVLHLGEAALPDLVDVDRCCRIHEPANELLPLAHADGSEEG